MCQFIDISISNQMEPTGKVSNVEQKNLYNALLYKKISQCLILRQLSPFDWKCLQIGTQRAKDLRKNGLILQKGASTHIPHKQPVIRVVLLQKRSNALIKTFAIPLYFGEGLILNYRNSNLTLIKTKLTSKKNPLILY